MKFENSPIIQSCVYILFVLLFFACKQKGEHLNYSELPALNDDGLVNVIIEIPAGTYEKWEYNSGSATIERDSIDGMPRTIDYLAYPANYGMIPNSLLSEEDGGDGDPLDVIVLGAPVPRGTVLRSKIIGVLLLNDNGEKDDKLIAVSKDSKYFQFSKLNELELQYPGILKILQLWFTHYKGPGIMHSKGYADNIKADSILRSGLKDYQESISDSI